MSLNAEGYFHALQNYLNTAHYGVTEVDGARIVLKDKIYRRGTSVPTDQKVRLEVPGKALVIHLDEKARGKDHCHPLFHFLDDNGKPWSKRCDYVVFHLHREKITALCIEFKSGSLPDSLVDQLSASEAWCKSLHSVIKHYTGESRKLQISKFVLSCHPNPAAFLEPTGKYLLRDHSIRHYLYTDIDGLSLDGLVNENIESVH